MLTNGYTYSSWFHKLAEKSSRFCLSGRIKFESPYGEKSAPTDGQCFFYFGDDVQLFEDVFCEFGSCRTFARANDGARP
jgi:hypothetical protein